MKRPTEGLDADVRKQKNYLYAVLNLPSDATKEEIKERHRALSLAFHPDRQRDERFLKTANEQFLELQTAYEVLSDPFRREVYDTIGYDGLSIQFPEYFTHLRGDELREALHTYFYENEAARIRSLINPKGTVSLSVDARKLFYNGKLTQEWYTDFKERLTAIRCGIVSVQHSLTGRINRQTSVQITSQMGVLGNAMAAGELDPSSRFSILRGNISSIVKHQYSRKSAFEVRANLIGMRSATVAWSYGDALDRIRISAPLRLSLKPPPITLLLRRRLSQTLHTLGSLKLVFQPTLHPHRLLRNVDAELSGPIVPKKGEVFASGLTYGLSLRLIGGPTVFVQWVGMCVPLGTTVKAVIQQSWDTGTSLVLGCAWSNEAGELGANAGIICGTHGITLKLALAYLGQTFDIPIVLSDQYSPGLALAATLIPSSIFAVTNYLGLRRLRAMKQEKLLRDLQKTGQLHAKRADAEAVMAMLSEPARRSLQYEKQTDGIVILDASYYPIDETGVPITDLTADVTVAVRALVSRGQLFIPGGRPKSALRGFFDPPLECSKRLSIRYEFRGRPHYVEVSDHAALVLPLESHLVETANSQVT